MKTLISFIEKRIVIISISIALITIGALVFGYYKTGHLNKIFENDIDHDYLGAFGDFLSGFLGAILGIITIYLVYKTYISQKEELELSRNLIQKQNFESSFFNLLNSLNTIKETIHREKYPDANDPTQKEFRGIIFFENKHKHLLEFNFIKPSKENTSVTADMMLTDFLKKHDDIRRKFAENTDFNSLNSFQKNRLKVISTYYRFYLEERSILDHYFQILKSIIIQIDSFSIDKISSSKNWFNPNNYYLLLQSQLSVSELFHIYHYCLLSENYRKLIVKSNILSRLNITDLIDKETHFSYYKSEIPISEKPTIFD